MSFMASYEIYTYAFSTKNAQKVLPKKNPLYLKNVSPINLMKLFREGHGIGEIIGRLGANLTNAVSQNYQKPAPYKI